MKTNNIRHLTDEITKDMDEVEECCKKLDEINKKLSDLNIPYNFDIDDLLVDMHFQIEGIREQIQYKYPINL